MVLDRVSTNRSFGGVQGVYRHASAATGTEMTFSVFVPEHSIGDRLPEILAVTAQDVREAAERIFAPENRVTLEYRVAGADGNGAEAGTGTGADTGDADADGAAAATTTEGN